MSKKKHDGENHIDETWLIPYADLLTLLLALFIVLFAASNTDVAKMSAMAQSFYEEYNGMLPSPKTGDPDAGGIHDGSEIMQMMPEGGDNPETSTTTVMTTTTEAGLFDEAPTTTVTTQPDGTSESGSDTNETLVTLLQNELLNYVETEGLGAEMKIEVRDDGLLITLTSDVWFASGSADINEPQKEVAAQVSEMIAAAQDEHHVKLSVIVSGHTDNVPMSGGSEFKNNWQLSVARAVNFMEELMNTSTLQPSNFSARGFGEYEPIDTNETPEGRQKNRRVEVLITPEAAVE